jgi:hypothetical protein
VGLLAADNVVVGAAALIVGAALTGALQLLVVWREHKHARLEAKGARKRAVYERYLETVSVLSPAGWDAIVTDKVGDWQRDLARAMAELRIGVLLDATPEIATALQALRDAVAQWGGTTASALRSAGPEESAPDVMQQQFDAVVYPAMKAVADLMAKDLESR